MTGTIPLLVGLKDLDKKLGTGIATIPVPLQESISTRPAFLGRGGFYPMPLPHAGWVREDVEAFLCHSLLAFNTA